MVSKKIVLASFLCCLLATTFLGFHSADAADFKVGIMNVQKVLTKSKAGATAKEKFQEKVKEYEGKFKDEQDALIALKSEIEKKGSLWSKEKKEEKMLEFNKKRREAETKAEDARLELKKLQDKELEPILKAMEKVVIDYGKKNNFTVILDSKSGIVYFDQAIDISDDLIVEMDKGIN